MRYRVVPVTGLIEQTGTINWSIPSIKAPDFYLSRLAEVGELLIHLLHAVHVDLRHERVVADRLRIILSANRIKLQKDIFPI